MEREQEQKILRTAFRRNFTVTREAIDQTSRTVSLAFASETPVERWYGNEILSCKPEAVRMGRLLNKAPLLENHEFNEQIGVVESATVDADGICRAVVRFSENPEPMEVFKDVVDGIKTKISVGYMVHSMVLESKTDAGETYRINDWEPYEISVVSVPADDAVGIARQLPTEEELDKKITARIQELVEKANETRNESKPNNPQTIERIHIMEPEVVNKEDVLKSERQRIADIESASAKLSGKITNIDELRTTAIKEGYSVEQFKGMAADRIGDGSAVFTPESELGLSKKQTKEYSFIRAIQSMIPGSRVDAKVEREASDEIAKKLGIETEGRFIPFEVQSRNLSSRLSAEEIAFYASQGIGRRDLLVSSATQAGNLVGTTLHGNDFISMLRNRSASGQFGVKMMNGLVGNVAIPRQTAAGSFYWVAEANAATESQLTIGQLTMSPNIGAAYQEYSTKLLLQSTPSVEALVQDDLYQIGLLGIDAAVFHGAGSDEPTGIAGTSGVGSVDATSIGWPGTVEFETDVATGNADVASMKFVMNAAARGILKTRPKEAGYPTYLMAENGQVNGYNSIISNQINSGYVFFGDGSQAIVGSWGVMEILVNPYILDKEGLVRVTMRVHVDVGVRQAAAFTVASNLS